MVPVLSDCGSSMRWPRYGPPHMRDRNDHSVTGTLPASSSHAVVYRSWVSVS